MIEEINNVLAVGSKSYEDKIVAAQKYLLEKNIGNGDNLQLMIDRIREYGVTVPTGYPDIDKILHGGFRTGLSIIASPPGKGKSTFSLQLAEQFSGKGIQTVYLCNDMSEEETTSKVLSRHTYLIDGEKGFGADEIMDMRDNGMEERLVFKEATSNFRKNASMLRIAGEDCSRSLYQIRTLLDAYGAYGSGQQLVVIIDYLQNIVVEDAKSDKERLDVLVRELKGLAKKYKIIIIAISSVNRSSYKQALAMDSLKESGGIEYGADLVLALQYEGVDGVDFNEEKASRGMIRDMELVVLKQRLGRSDAALKLKFYPKFNLFPYYDSTPKMKVTTLKIPK